jgi:hypothetical protein
MAVVAFGLEQTIAPSFHHEFFMLRPNLPERLHASKADPAPQTRIIWRKIERHPKEEVTSAVCKGSLLRLPMTLCNGGSVNELLYCNRFGD